MPKRGSKTSTLPAVWATVGIFSARSKWFPVVDWWPRTKPGYITMIRRQSNNQWSGGIAAHPAPKKNPSAKIRWKSSRLDSISLGGSRRHPPHWLSPKGPNCQRGVLLISAGAIEGNFEGKTPREGNQGVLFLHDNAPAHRALATQKKLAYLDFQCLDHPPYSPDLAPSDYHLFPGLKKKSESSPFFVRQGGHCCRGTCSCHLRGPAGLRQNEVFRHPLKVIGGLGACLGVSEKGRHPFLQTYLPKSTYWLFRWKLSTEWDILLAEWFKSFIKGLKLWKK